MGYFPITLAVREPISAGLSQTSTPATLNASFFSFAVPLPPAMIAPACPIRLPGGAVLPAMKLTTGLEKWSLMSY